MYPRQQEFKLLCMIALGVLAHSEQSNIAVWRVGPDQSDEHRDDLDEHLFSLHGDGFIDQGFCDKYVEAGGTFQGGPASRVEKPTTIRRSVFAIALCDV